jgi:hypothetical protein
MKRLRQFFLILIFVGSTIDLSSHLATVNSIPQAVILAFKNGNAEQLASFFNPHIELVMIGQSDVYSKSQAQIILKKFFRQNVPENFEVLQRGQKEKVSFVIGRLITSNGKFKVYILGKGTGNQYKIHQLRIEKDYG